MKKIKAYFKKLRNRNRRVKFFKKMRKEGKNFSLTSARSTPFNSPKESIAEYEVRIKALGLERED